MRQHDISYNTFQQHNNPNQNKQGAIIRMNEKFKKKTKINNYSIQVSQNKNIKCKIIKQKKNQETQNNSKTKKKKKKKKKT